MFYYVDFTYNESDQIQKKLDFLYDYHSVGTKILHRSRINLFYILMQKLIKRNIINSFNSAIDIGCNSGVYSKIISDFGFKYVLGIDINENMIKKAKDFFGFKKQKKTLEFKLMNAENLTQNKKFDFILCTEVIEHTNNPMIVVDNIKKILAPRGIAIITLPNKISLPYYSTLIFYKIKDKTLSKSLKDHVNYPFYKSIILFKEKQFKIVTTSGTNLFFTYSILNILHNKKMFHIINKINFYSSKLWPFKYFTQFFFIVIKNKSIV